MNDALVGSGRVHHVTLTGNFNRGRRQDDHLVVEGSRGSTEAIVDDHDLASVTITPDAARKVAVLIGDGDNLVAVGTTINGHDLIAAPLAAHVAAKVTEAVVLVVAEEDGVVFTHNRATGLLNDGDAILIELTAVRANIADAPRLVSQHKSSDEARCCSYGCGGRWSNVRSATLRCGRLGRGITGSRRRRGGANTRVRMRGGRRGDGGRWRNLPDGRRRSTPLRRDMRRGRANRRLRVRGGRRGDGGRWRNVSDSRVRAVLGCDMRRGRADRRLRVRWRSVSARRMRAG